MATILKPESLTQLVFFVRGEKVMLDADLAMLYGVEARALNQAVKRNRNRFPEDFMFQLTAKEAEAVQSNSSQSVMSSRKHRGHAIVLTLSPTRALRCCRVCFEANALSKST